MSQIEASAVDAGSGVPPMRTSSPGRLRSLLMDNAEPVVTGWSVNHLGHPRRRNDSREGSQVGMV